MKVISFIGAGFYQVSRYRYGEEEVKTHLFPYAMARFFKPESLLIVLTPKAEEAKASFKPDDEAKAESYFNEIVRTHNLKVLHDRNKTYFEQLCEIHQAQGLVTPEKVLIPNGESEQELWQIFNVMAASLKEKEEVVFDITHAFRSLPLLAFIAAAYLRMTKNIKLKAIVYGAFEAKYKREGGTEITPVFDLTPFVDLLDWMTATEQFLKTGSATSLAELLRPQAQTLAENISNISQSLHLLRPREVMRAAANLPSEINNVKAQIEKQLPPFALLMQQVEKDYGRFGVRNITDDRETLIRQLEIAEWYKTKGQLVHALSIAREWLPSLLCYSFRIDSSDKNIREKMEHLLSGSASVQVNSTRYEWNNIAYGARLRLLWNNPFKLANLRNDVLHAGFSQNPRSADEVTKQTESVLNELREIAKLWNLL